MIGWLFLPVTIFLIVILFFSVVFWAIFPDWFGIFGYKRKTPVGKIIISLLFLFQIITVICLLLAWNSTGGPRASFYILIPLIYIVLLWIYRVDKNKRCFKTKENNLQYFLQDVNRQLVSFDRLIKNENKFSLSFFCLVPNEACIQNITKAIESNCQYVREYYSGGYLVNKVLFIEGFTKTISSVENNEVKNQLSQLIRKVWDAGGEFGGWRLVPQKMVDDRIELDEADIK